MVAPIAPSLQSFVAINGGIVTSATGTTLTDSKQAWTTNQWTNYYCQILSGTGAGEWLGISSNTATVLTLGGTWAQNPDTTSQYGIFAVLPGISSILGQGTVIQGPPYSVAIPTYTVYKSGTLYYATASPDSGLANVVSTTTDFGLFLNTVISNMTTGRIFIRNGTYTNTVAITDQGKSGISISGEGYGTLISVSGGIHGISIGTVSNWVIENLRIDGTSQTGAFNLIQFGSGTTNSYIKNCYANAASQYHILLEGTENSAVNNFVTSAGADSIVIHNPATRCSAIGNICDSTTTHNNISLVTTTDCLVENNYCYNAGNGGGTTMYGIALENLGSGANLRATVIGNLVSTSGGSGIVVYPRSGGVDSATDCSISNNTVVSPGLHGIEIDSGTRLQINNNTIYNYASGEFGIYGTVGTLAHIQMNNNLIDAASLGSNCIYFNTAGCTDVQIVGNTMVNPVTGASGISLQGVTHFVISGNKFKEETTTLTINGILLGATCIKGIVTGNHLYALNASGTAIYLHTSSSDITVQGNYCDQFSVGIKEDASGNNNTILNNDVRNIRTTLISVVGNNTIVKGNQGYNPLNVLATPFDNTAFVIGLTAANTPAALPTSTANDYTVVNTDLVIADTTANGGTLTIKDPAGTTVAAGYNSATTPITVPVGYKVRFVTALPTAIAVAAN